MKPIEYTESVEFRLAKIMWESATDDHKRSIAIELFEKACERKDGAAFLELYKINAELRDGTRKLSYIFNDNSAFLSESLKLSYLPAYLHAGGVEDYSVYERLIFLSIGMFVANMKKSSELNDFQVAFVKLSTPFAAEFIPEILEIGQQWVQGEYVDINESKLEGNLIQHPEKYTPKFDKKRAGWSIFQDCASTENYLRFLPGSDEYFKACEAEETDDMDQWRFHMEIAEAKGNGQAIYALKERTEKNTLFAAAQNGSVDAFIDLIDDLNDYFGQYQYSSSQDYDFYNTTRIETKDEEKFLSAINCFLYLYSIMQRLGIGKYCSSSIQVARLTTKTDSGYQFWGCATAHELKYELCSHKLACQMNDRSFSWKLGDKFDSTFYENFAVVMKNLD